MSATIGICLATLNGARYLDEQLQSIAAQTFADRMTSGEAKEGVASFLEKRDPKWTDR